MVIITVTTIVIIEDQPSVHVIWKLKSRAVMNAKECQLLSLYFEFCIT